LTAHYRNFLEYSEELLDSARHARENLIKKVQKTCDIDDKIISDIDTLSYDQFKENLSSKYVGDALEDMMAALMDDLNIPQVLAILNQMLNNMHKTEEVESGDLIAALYRLEKNILKI
jgi:cysteinyl-tRNA synthetase